MGKTFARGHLIAGGCAIAVFAALLTVRVAGLPRFLSTSSHISLSRSEELPTGEFWMNITQSGQKIGFAKRSYARAEKGFRLTEQIFMNIRTMGIEQPLSVSTEAELHPDRTLSRFRFDLKSSLFQFTARGEVKGTALHLRTGDSADGKASVIELPEPPYLGIGIMESVASERLRKGEERTFPVFDPASLGQRQVKIVMLDEEEIQIAGQGRWARKLSVDFMGMKQTAWVGPDGTLLREEGILGIALERTTREVALAGLGSAMTTDLTELASVPSNRQVGDALSLKRLKIRLEGLPRALFQLDGDRQTFRDGVLTVRREPFAVSSARPEGSSANIEALLKPSLMIQSDHPKIREQAGKIVASGDPDETKAQKLVAWVYNYLEKRPVLSVPNALETLQNRTGDCNEHAVLLAALARAAGIPAEVEAGIVHLHGRFFYHAWNVLYLKDRGGWITADSALGQIPADVTHIRFVRGGTERQLDLVGLIGNLKLDILEMER